MKTNVEFVTELMERSAHGPLIQAFVIEALENYSRQFAEMKSQPKGWPNWIHFPAWQGCAVEVQNKLGARMSGHVIDGQSVVV